MYRAHLLVELSRMSLQSCHSVRNLLKFVFSHYNTHHHFYPYLFGWQSNIYESSHVTLFKVLVNLCMFTCSHVRVHGCGGHTMTLSVGLCLPPFMSSRSMNMGQAWTVSVLTNVTISPPDHHGQFLSYTNCFEDPLFLWQKTRGSITFTELWFYICGGT